MMEGREGGFQCARQQVVFPDCVRKASAPGFARSQHLVSPRCLDKLQLHESAGDAASLGLTESTDLMRQWSAIESACTARGSLASSR